MRLAAVVKKTAQRLGSFARGKLPPGTVAGAVSGIIVTLVGNSLWQHYTSPHLRVDGSVAVTSRRFVIRGDSTTWQFVTRDAVKECTMYEVHAQGPAMAHLIPDSVRLTWRMVLDNPGPVTINDIRFLLRTTMPGAVQVRATPTIDVEFSDRSFAPVAPHEMLIKVKALPPDLKAVLTVQLDGEEGNSTPNSFGFLTLFGSNEVPAKDIESQPIAVVDAITAEWETVQHSEVFMGDLPDGFSKSYLIESAGNPSFIKSSTCKTPQTPWPYSLNLP